MKLIDADSLPRHGNRGGLVNWYDIEKAPTVEAIPTDWIIAYIKAKMDKVADMVKADGNEHEMGMEIVEAIYTFVLDVKNKIYPLQRGKKKGKNNEID